MYRPRIIPVLLLKGSGLVKSIKFGRHKYIGDPLNAARIFNELCVDELIFLDVDASHLGQRISLEFAGQVAEEVTIPFSVGGGIASLDDIRSIIKAGVEKVVIGTAAASNPDFIRRAADEFGSSTISVCIDVKKRFFHGQRVYALGGGRSTKFAPVEFAQLMEHNGAGELIVQSIDRDGTMSGYEIDLIRRVSAATTVPVVALGGAGKAEHLLEAVKDGQASAAAAGSLFVYFDTERGVLINYDAGGIFK